MKFSSDAKLIASSIILAALLISASIYLSAPARQPTSPAQPATAPSSKSPAQPAPSSVNLSGTHVKGDPSAPVLIVEYSDFQCPFCAEFWRSTLPSIERDFISTGKARLAYKHFPIENIHPLAETAAEAAECAGEQGKFWEYHDLLFANQRSLSDEPFASFAANLSLDLSEFNACLEGRRKAEVVAAHQAEALSNGVRGTPTFLINGRQIVGAQPYAVFKSAIEDALAG